MEKYYMTFRSVTYAQKAQRALEQEGQRCFLQRAPKWMSSRGCGYAIAVADPRNAAEILKSKNAPWEKAFRVRGSETWEVPGL